MADSYTIEGVGKWVRISLSLGVGIAYLMLTGSWLGVICGGWVSFCLLVQLSRGEFSGSVHGTAVALILGLFDEETGGAAFFMWWFLVMSTYDE